MDPTLFLFLASVWHLGSLWPIQYSKDYLLIFEKSVISGPPVDLIIPDLEELAGLGKGDHFRTPERRPRRRGRRGGVRERMRRQHPSRIPLPSIILSNARSLRNKTDELQALVRHQHAFKDACILAFSETWLGERDADGDLVIDGFGIPFRTDRKSTTTGKSCGGGVCAYINERWCKNVIVRERLCTKDVELLSLSMRPMYLPREFPQIFVTVVYVHPKANEENASELISQSVHKLQSLSPDAPNLVLGDFNHCSLDKSLRSFYQYVSCPTRKNRILDKCYGSIKNAYKSISFPPLGSADHNCVYLVPSYRTCLQRGKVTTRNIKVWSEEATLTLQGCLESTDWEVFTESSRDIHELTDVVSSWVTYCEDIVVPVKTVRIYPNSKPWASRQLKVLLNKKKQAFKQGDSTELMSVHKEIKREIRRAKLSYKRKLEDMLSNNNMGSAWDSIRSMVGLTDNVKKRVSLDGFTSDLVLAQELNKFYSRFDVYFFNNEIMTLRNTSLESKQCFSPFFDEYSVVKTFKHCKIRTSAGPDNISSRLLSNCAVQLGPIFNYIFNLSLSQQKVPNLWKQSTIVPVGKFKHPKSLNDFRPIALTSLVMKSLEKLIKAELLKTTEHRLDPLQFAYRTKRGVQDATITLLNYICKHLDSPNNHVRLMFVDFSSAFNTIQPHLLIQRLRDNFGLEGSIVGWILDFLTGRTQRVRVNGKFSDLSVTSTGSPQGCVLSPLLYILYTNDCCSSFENRHILKFADDTVIVSLLNSTETSHGPVIDYFLKWCQESFLSLNVLKTKDMCIDFRRVQPSPDTIVIDGQTVESVESYKYLGTFLDNKLTFKKNTDSIHKKSQQRLFCLRKLSKFQVDSTLMILFYRSFIESIITFSFVCWFQSLRVKERNLLNKVVSVSSKIIGLPQETLQDLYEKQLFKKANSILTDFSHPLYLQFQFLPSGSLLRLPFAKTNRFKHSFVPSAVSLLNARRVR